MLRTQVVLLTVLVSLVLAATTQAKAVPRMAGRVKRQAADVQTAAYLAWIALGGKYPPHGCAEIGCGVVDIISRVKRQSADVLTAQFLAWIALGGKNTRHGCRTIGCNVVDVFSRAKRSGSDQRIAELQALMALAGNKGLVAHGAFDPLRIGKRKRADGTPLSADEATDEERYQLLKALVERAAQRFANPSS